MRLISVAVPVPFLDLLTYRVPDTMALPPVGARVRVPVGSRTLTGCVVAHDATIAEGTDAKEIVEALDLEPFVPPSVVGLCRWVAEYYVSGIGDALAVAMPPGARGRASAFKTLRIATLSALESESGDGSCVTPTRVQRSAGWLEAANNFWPVPTSNNSTKPSQPATASRSPAWLNAR